MTARERASSQVAVIVKRRAEDSPPWWKDGEYICVRAQCGVCVRRYCVHACLSCVSAYVCTVYVCAWRGVCVCVLT